MPVRFLAAGGEATAGAASRPFQDELHENIRWGWLTNYKTRMPNPDCRILQKVAASKLRVEAAFRDIDMLAILLAAAH
jgi:hypothetical protein